MQRETDLYPAVKAWLLAQGCTKVVPEVPICFSKIDAMGVSEADVFGVEMKLCLTDKLIHQANDLQLYANRSYAAIGSKPRRDSLERVRELGIGLLRVNGEVVEVLLNPSPKFKPNPFYIAQAREKVAHMSDAGGGGAPCLDGVGPARECKARVEDYLKEHPAAKWKEIYANVPNHYASAKNMAGALMTGIALRDHWKQIRRERHAAGCRKS